MPRGRGSKLPSEGPRLRGPMIGRRHRASRIEAMEGTRATERSARADRPTEEPGDRPEGAGGGGTRGYGSSLGQSPPQICPKNPIFGHIAPRRSLSLMKAPSLDRQPLLPDGLLTPSVDQTGRKRPISGINRAFGGFRRVDELRGAGLVVALLGHAMSYHSECPHLETCPRMETVGRFLAEPERFLSWRLSCARD